MANTQRFRMIVACDQAVRLVKADRAGEYIQNELCPPPRPDRSMFWLAVAMVAAALWSALTM